MLLALRIFRVCCSLQLVGSRLSILVSFFPVPGVALKSIVVFLRSPVQYTNYTEENVFHTGTVYHVVGQLKHNINNVREIRSCETNAN